MEFLNQEDLIDGTAVEELIEWIQNQFLESKENEEIEKKFIFPLLHLNHWNVLQNFDNLSWMCVKETMESEFVIPKYKLKNVSFEIDQDADEETAIPKAIIITISPESK